MHKEMLYSAEPSTKIFNIKLLAMAIQFEYGQIRKRSCKATLPEECLKKLCKRVKSMIDSMPRQLVWSI